MELFDFNGDSRIIQNDDVHDFPGSSMPFPEPLDMHYRSPEIEYPQPQLPPQKLRPIRCGGRAFLAAEGGGFQGDFLNPHDELGFLNSQLSPEKLSLVNGDCTETPVDSLQENGGNPVVGKASLSVDIPAVQKLESEINAEGTNLFEAESSSFSDDGGDSSRAVTKPLNRKRKRKERKNLELFVENMMRNVIQKQEQMHKQLIEMIEKKESERIIREEAWKQQEIERAKKDEEVRAQERSRSLAFMSFIQNLIDHKFQITKSFDLSCLQKDECDINCKQSERSQV